MTGRSRTLARRGFTLIEVAVVVSITSVLFALSATTIIALIRLERQFAVDADLQRSLGRLALRLREDAHAARSAQCSSDCELEMADQSTVSYTYSDRKVVRQHMRGETIAHRDSFWLGRDAEVRFSLVPQGSRQLVVLTLNFSAGGQPVRASQVGGSFEIAAAVNLLGERGEEAMP